MEAGEGEQIAEEKKKEQETKKEQQKRREGEWEYTATKEPTESTQVTQNRWSRNGAMIHEPALETETSQRNADG